MPRRPSLLLHAVWIAALLLFAGATGLALQEPVLGSWQVQPGGGVRCTLDLPGVAPLPVGAEVTSLAGGGERVMLERGDFWEDPDFAATYPQFERFLERQDRLSAILASGAVTLTWRDGASEGTRTLSPRQRHLSDLPAPFWVQLVVAVCGLTIAGWVVLLRPGDFPARMLFVTGAMLLLALLPAAIYTARSLALPGETLRLYSGLNHAATLTFGCAFVALFATYPRRLIAPSHLLWLPVVFGMVLLADQRQWGDSLDVIFRGPMVLQLLLAMVLGAWQWRASRGHPLERAALRWFLLAVLLGCLLVTYAAVLPHMLGAANPMSQGYGTAFFLIMYLGLALGLGRYRLFDMDAWTYRVFLWAAGSTAVIALDWALIALLGLGQNLSLGLTLLLCGWLYFPFRQWLWQHLVGASPARLEALLPDLSQIAFAVPAEREGLWRGLLARLFDPLRLEPGDGAGAGVQVLEEGLALAVPPSGGLGGVRLVFAGRGARLFSSRDAEMVRALTHLLEQMVQGRHGFERGRALERQRIGRDLHDNIGARLLKLIHHLRGTPDADIARDAMKDLRTAIAAIDAPPVPLVDALADWRAEAQDRCEVAGVELIWSQQGGDVAAELPPRLKAALESVLREALTNALKHADPDRVTVRIDAMPPGLRIELANDGTAPPPAQWQEGYGLRSMRSRLREFGGTLNLTARPDGVAVTMEIQSWEAS